MTSPDPAHSQEVITHALADSTQDFGGEEGSKGPRDPPPTGPDPARSQEEAAHASEGSTQDPGGEQGSKGTDTSLISPDPTHSHEEATPASGGSVQDSGGEQGSKGTRGTPLTGPDPAHPQEEAVHASGGSTQDPGGEQPSNESREPGPDAAKGVSSPASLDAGESTSKKDIPGARTARKWLNSVNPLKGLRRKATSPPNAQPPASDSEQQREINIVVFGETGVGKSSIINLIIGEKQAPTSNAALGCTFGHEHYHIQLDEKPFALWDTAGLDEGSAGTVPAEEAEKNLKNLLENLSRSGGIHLIVYCIRGGRLTKALEYNYDLFYAMVCRRKVPIALVVTGLEHQKGEMETWWTQNEAELHRHHMRFDDHACVTSLGEDIQDGEIPTRRTESQNQLRRLVQKYAMIPGWKVDTSFISRTLPLLRKFLVHSSKDASEGATKARKVVVCDSFPGIFVGTTFSWDKGRYKTDSMTYDFLRVDKDSLSDVALEDFKGTGLIVFYASALTENRLELTDVAALKKLHDVAGGQGCPMIVILRDCNDKGVAWNCRHQIVSAHRDVRPHVIIPSDAGEKMIQTVDVFYLESIEGEVQTVSEKPHGNGRK